MSNKYGLILPEKGQKKPVFQATRNVFGDESDSEDEASKKKPVRLQTNQSSNRQAKLAQEKAVLDDPTVFQYDEIYDSMVEKKTEEKSKTKVDKKPRYIENLLKTAQKRKIENERRIERQVQKERENEGEEFADKEVFVTSAYKKKLEEMKQEEEKEKREEYLEKIGDVTKQQDLGGFYRHLYEQKLGSDKPAVTKDVNPTTETNKDNESESFKEKISKKSEPTKHRNYRKRNKSTDKLSEGEIASDDDEVNRPNFNAVKKSKMSQDDANIDADSDFSIDSSGDEEESPVKSPEGSPKVEKRKSESKSDKTKVDKVKKEDKTDKDTETKEKEVIQSPKATENVKIDEPPKPKIDVWKKRTVREVFEAALMRYYQRKSARA